MSAELLKDWSTRVEELEVHVRLAQKDLELLHSSEAREKQKLRRLQETKASEKQTLLEELEAVELEAKKLQIACESVVAAREKVDEAYQQALDQYEQLHFMVREIQEMEEEKIINRIDYEKVLEQETAAWGEEEHQLRRQLQEAQQRVAEHRRAAATERWECEEELRRLEQQLKKDRGEREQQEADRLASTSFSPTAPSRHHSDATAGRGRASTLSAVTPSDGRAHEEDRRGRRIVQRSADPYGRTTRSVPPSSTVWNHTAHPTPTAATPAGLKSCLKTASLPLAAETTTAPMRRGAGRALVGVFPRAKTYDPAERTTLQPEDEGVSAKTHVGERKRRLLLDRTNYAT